jgi:phosphate transport system protein
MTILMQKEFDKLKKALFTLSTLVEEAVNLAVKAVATRDAELARKVVDSDNEIDHMEIEVEEECLKILALHQPVASDLRYIVAVLKLNSDLERMGDLAVGMARNAVHLADLPAGSIPFDVHPMSELVRTMLENSLDSLVNLDVNLARRVLATDKQVDALNKEMLAMAARCHGLSEQEMDCLLRFVSIARNLERIADHTTNVAEDVIYLVDGEIVRHNAKAKA